MFKKLSPQEIRVLRETRSEYVEFLRSLRPGEGGQISVADADVGRQSVKNRLKAAAQALGLGIKFLRSGKEVVIFEIADKK